MSHRSRHRQAADQRETQQPTDVQGVSPARGESGPHSGAGDRAHESRPTHPDASDKAGKDGGGAGQKAVLIGYLDRLVESLRELIPQAISGDEEAVHDARVATRRLKAATDLLEPVLPGKLLKTFRKTLKNLRKNLGPLRDAEVMLGHCRQWLEEGKNEIGGGPSGAAGDNSARRAATDAALHWLIERLKEQRNSALREVASDVHGPQVLTKLGKWWGLRCELKGKESNIEGLMSESLQRQFSQFAQEAQELGSAINGGARAAESSEAIAGEPAVALAAIPVTDSPSQRRPDPHALRISGKLLRYTLEMASAHGWPLPDSVAKSFKQLQQALGLWHDWVVLAQEVMRHSVDAEVAYHDLALQQQLLALAQMALRRANLQLAVMVRLWKRRGPSLQKAVFRVLPTQEMALDELIGAPKTNDSVPGNGDNDWGGEDSASRADAGATVSPTEQATDDGPLLEPSPQPPEEGEMLSEI